MFILLELLSSLILFTCLLSADPFLPDANDFDAYGLKIASNNLMIVEAFNWNSDDDNDLVLIIRFAPYSNDITQTENRTCVYFFDDRSWFIYAIAVGKNQSVPNIFFVGERVGLEEYNELENRTFVGVVTYKGNLSTLDCDNGFTINFQFVQRAFHHQEHLVMVTDPVGLVAYGFSADFTFSYTASTNTLIVQNNLLSPSTLFRPHAVDYDGSRGIIVGSSRDSQSTRYIPTVILFNIDASTANVTLLDTWTYPNNSLRLEEVYQYNAKFSMSVRINPTATQVLFGIQLMNTVFLFNYTTTSLTLVTSVNNGQGIGFGKSVVWLSDTPDSIAILANVYSTSNIWNSSKIYIYESLLMNDSTPISTFPNIQQPLPNPISSVFLNIITTANYLLLQDIDGSIFVIFSAPSGYYSSTEINLEIRLRFSVSLPCIAGTFKNVTGIRPCRPCPTGTKNTGINVTITTCIDCANNTFCPLGSPTDSITNDQISNVIQVVAYPESPDVTGLDDILFFTLFSIGSTGRCVVLSPIFWTLIVAAIVILIVTVMLVMKYCVKDPKAEKSFKIFRKIFRRTDLIREGEMWAGGLATLCVLVLCISCCVFSAKYYSSYPIETAGPSTYTCDTNIHNAQFSTSLQALSVPAQGNVQRMIGLLNDQAISLDVSFLNTVFNCTSDAVTLKYLLGSTWVPVPSYLSCNSSNYIVSYSALLPLNLKRITVQFTLSNRYIIGGLRVGLSGAGKKASSTATVQDLAFSQTLNQSGRMLGPDAHIDLHLTKVINSTSPLVSGDNDILTGIWTGSFLVNYYDSFITDIEYMNTSPGKSRNVTLVISETAYFVLNKQSPIARLPEIVYHVFLFITMIIGMFVLVFVIYEVLILPCFTVLIRICKSNPGKKYRTDSNDGSTSDQNDLENPTSIPNKRENSEYKYNNAASLRRQISTSIRYRTRNKRSKQQMSSIWNRQAYI